MGVKEGWCTRKSKYSERPASIVSVFTSGTRANTRRCGEKEGVEIQPWVPADGGREGEREGERDG